MRKMLAALAGVFCLLSFPASADEQLLVLDVAIQLDGEQVSAPRIALAPGTDGSIRQGLEGDFVLALGFHAVHLEHDRARLLMDVAAGVGDPTHRKAQYLELPWDEPYELVFSTMLDGPSVRILFTPSKGSRSALMQKSDQ